MYTAGLGIHLQVSSWIHCYQFCELNFVYIWVLFYISVKSVLN